MPRCSPPSEAETTHSDEPESLGRSEIRIVNVSRWGGRATIDGLSERVRHASARCSRRFDNRAESSYNSLRCSPSGAVSSHRSLSYLPLSAGSSAGPRTSVSAEIRPEYVSPACPLACASVAAPAVRKNRVLFDYFRVRRSSSCDDCDDVVCCGGALLRGRVVARAAATSDVSVKRQEMK